MKTCNKCFEEKNITEFYRAISNTDGYMKLCKKCHMDRQWIYRQTEKGKAKDRRYSTSEKGKANYRKGRKVQYEKNRLSHIISSYMRQSLNGGKCGRRWTELVGWTVDDLKQHLESQFTEGMTWDNHGQVGWHIDHKIPVSSFNITSYKCNDFKKCWSLNNLQPLWYDDNIRKGNKVEKIYKK
jgi:hypothetical protein